MEPLERNEDYTIGTTVTRVCDSLVASQGERLVLFVENNSTGGQTFRVAIGATATSTKGIRLTPGGSITWQKELGIPVTQSFVTAVSDLAGGTLTIFERIQLP